MSKKHQFKKGEFTVVPNKNSLRGKPGRLQLVHFWLNDYADESGQCFPSRKRLADDCHISVQSVDLSIKELCGLGLLVKETRIRQDGSQAANRYTIMEG